MMSALFEFVAYVVAEMLSYVFVRLFVCMASSIFVAAVVCGFVPDRALHPGIIAIIVVTGFILGIVWEARASKGRQSSQLTQSRKRSTMPRRPSNHAIERTPKAFASRLADRCGSTFEMTSAHSPRATRALVRRRSSCSR
jgi:hypothetical protein